MKVQIDRFLELLKVNDIAGIQQLLTIHPDLVHAKTEQGVSLLLLAAYYRNETVKNILLQKRNQLDIFEAAAFGQLKTVAQALEQTPGLINAFAPDGFTALGLAAFFGRKEVVKYLLEKGANAALPSNNGMQVAPIHSAVAENSVPIAALLLDHGADVNATQMRGVTALHSAVHRNNLEMVKLLLDHGAEPHPKMEDGKRPLDIALAEGHQKLAEFLQQYSK